MPLLPADLQAQLEIGMKYAQRRLMHSMFPTKELRPEPTTSEIIKEVIEDRRWRGVTNFLEKEAAKWLEKGLSTFQFRCSTGMFIWIANDDDFDKALEAYKQRLLDKITCVQSELSDEIYGRNDD